MAETVGTSDLGAADLDEFYQELYGEPWGVMVARQAAEAAVWAASDPSDPPEDQSGADPSLTKRAIMLNQFGDDLYDWLPTLS